MKHLFLLSTLLIMICMTACQKERLIEQDQNLFEEHVSLDKETTAALESISGILPSDEELKTYEPTEGIEELRKLYEAEVFYKMEHSSCDGIEAIATLSVPRLYINANDLATGLFLIRLWDDNQSSGLDESEFSADTRVLGLRMMKVAHPFDHFDYRDIRYAQYQGSFGIFDCENI